ncbi:hypothetical protein G6F32_015650 [Rhizopus arrhizus]|nr:hypothetical protein G6F32_015650 [Rhizopus arrhizus]
MVDHRSFSHSLLALRQRPRRAVTGTLVLGDPAGPGHPSAAGCVHRLRHPAVVAVAAAPDDGLQRLHHRPGLYRVAAAGLCAGLVRLRAAVGGQGAGRGPAGQQRLPGLGPDGQGAG